MSMVLVSAGPWLGWLLRLIQKETLALLSSAAV